jgi:hypothetical protein
LEPRFLQRSKHAAGSLVSNLTTFAAAGKQADGETMNCVKSGIWRKTPANFGVIPAKAGTE